MRLVLFAMLAACSAGPTEAVRDASTDGAMDNAARERSFEQVLRPIVIPCLSCHRSQPPILSTYAQMTAAPAHLARYTMKPGAANVLVTKGGPTNSHQGLDYFTPAQQQAVAAWIDSL